METVKVDVQKLQLLNDRIAQTIDALNMLRMSVQGNQTTPWGAAAYGAPGQLPWALQASAGQPFARGFAPQLTPFTPFGGLQQAAFATPHAGSTGGWTPYTNGTTGPTVGGWTPYTNGISHSPWEPVWQSWSTWDPTLRTRATQTFPFVSYPIS